MTHSLISLVFVFISLYFLVLGGKVFISKRPFVMPAKYNLVLLVIVFATQLVQPLSSLFTERRYASESTDWFLYAIPLLLILMYSGLLLFLWKSMQGYSVIGVTEDSFRDGLKNALARLSLPYEETLSRMRLTSLGIDLQSSINAWSGVATLKIKDHRYKDDEKRIARALEDELELSRQPLNLNTSYFYLGMGGLLLIFALTFSYWVWTTDTFWKNF